MGKHTEGPWITQRVGKSARDGTHRNLINTPTSLTGTHLHVHTHTHTHTHTVCVILNMLHCFCICRHVGKALGDNYCRNPNNDVRPWCYTMDKNTPWEYCNISVCGMFTFPPFILWNICIWVLAIFLVLFWYCDVVLCFDPNISPFYAWLYDIIWILSVLSLIFLTHVEETTLLSLILVCVWYLV